MGKVEQVHDDREGDRQAVHDEATINVIGSGGVGGTAEKSFMQNIWCYV